MLTDALINMLQISATRLLEFDGFEERLKVAFPKAAASFALDELEKKSGPVFHGARKNLQEVTLFVAIDQDSVMANGVQRLVDFADTIAQRVVVTIGYAQKFDAILLESTHRVDHVVA